MSRYGRVRYGRIRHGTARRSRAWQIRVRPFSYLGFRKFQYIYIYIYVYISLSLNRESGQILDQYVVPRGLERDLEYFSSEIETLES